MEGLKQDLDNLNDEIRDLEIRVQKAKDEAESNILPLEAELSQVKEDKRQFALKNDFDSIQTCRRREENLKFKISAQWNQYSMLKNDLSRLNTQKRDLENQIKLEEDKIRRNREILSRMDEVLTNYRKSQDLKKAAIDSNISPDYVRQWFEWGKGNFNETYSCFYTQIREIDNHFKNLEAEKLKSEMDSVIEAYRKTNSLKRASELAGVSYDTVQYWYEWGSRGFGEENTYFYKNIIKIGSLNMAYHDGAHKSRTV
jgi:predicted site-specific integrase-resolvase